MCCHWQRDNMNRLEQTKLNAFDKDQYFEYSGARIMTGTMTCYIIVM
jgi:hypothetical protein